MSKTRPKRIKKYDVEDLHLASGAILKGMGLLSESEYETRLHLIYCKD